jgi:hypothetical protein
MEFYRKTSYGATPQKVIRTGTRCNQAQALFLADRKDLYLLDV